MNKIFYPRLSINNIKKNKSTYFPYMLSSIAMIALFYILHAIFEQAKVGTFYGDSSMVTVLGLGVYVAGIFSVIFIYYTNSFLIKRRKKELGLYSILGMEKKHIGKVLLFEVIYSGGISLIMGILSGILFGRLMFALLLNIMNLSTTIKFSIPVKSIGITALLFILTYGVIMLSNIRQIHINNPLDLMKSNKEGEKEPKANWILAILGAIFLGIGYYLALTVKHPIDSIYTFFIAVICVIIATYLIFTAGSISVLKILKRNRKFYYNRKHFIPVSSMMYRMKQNAIGLGNICILSAAVLLTLSTTISLYVGFEDIMRHRFPNDVYLNYIYEGQDREVVLDTIENHSKKYDISISNLKDYHILSSVSYREGDRLIRVEGGDADSLDNLYETIFIPLVDYNKNTGKNESLSDGEMLIWSDKDFDYENMEIFNHTFKFKKEVEKIDFIGSFSHLTSTVIVIVPDMEAMEELSDIINDDEENHNTPVYGSFSFDLDGDLDSKMEFCSTLRETLNQSVERVATVENIYTARQDFLSIYGSLLFIGIFIGSFFMIATVLTIYYKQISEGYDDQHRFQIMQKVGMSKDEVKNTINGQVQMVFFLPLITAIIHILVAFPIVNKILTLLNLTNTKLFLMFTGVVILIFTFVYFIVYKLTARVYYRIVR